jgi:hypothetical protein
MSSQDGASAGRQPGPRTLPQSKSGLSFSIRFAESQGFFRRPETIGRENINCKGELNKKVENDQAVDLTWAETGTKRAKMISPGMRLLTDGTLVF